MLVTATDLSHLHKLFRKKNPNNEPWSKWDWGEFDRCLEDRSTHLHEIIKYLRPRFQITNRAIRNNEGFLFSCILCGGPAVGTSKHNCVCSTKCVNDHARQAIVKNALSWELIGLRATQHRNANQVHNRIDLKCTECGNQKTFGFSWLLGKSYDCICRQGTRISATRRAGNTHADFAKRLIDRGVHVKLLSNYRDDPGRLKVRCLDCGNISVTCSQNLLSNRFCRSCGLEKYETTMSEKYGEHWQQKKSAWMQRGMVRKHGHQHALQVPKFFNKMAKNSFKTTKVHYKDRTLLLQGWEPQALKWLTKTTAFCKLQDILHASEDGCPSIRYDYAGKTRVYHPDFYIPSKNLIIEVKSWYTYATNLKLNRAKRDACEEHGFKFRFLIVDVNRKVTTIMSPLEALSKWNQRRRLK